MKEITLLFDGQTYGDKYTFAVCCEGINYKGEKYYTFGKLYKDNFRPFYFRQGVQSFENEQEAIKAAVRYSGKKIEKCCMLFESVKLPAVDCC